MERRLLTNIGASSVSACLILKSLSWLSDKLNIQSKLKNLNIPILVMHGRNDNIVPFEMGKEIFNNSKEPKFKYFNDIDDHMMDYNVDLIKSINKFIESLN